MIALSHQLESVCILRLSAIGDCCHTLPVVRMLQAAWPQTRFTWVIGTVEASLLGDIPGIEFLVYDKKRKLVGDQSFREAMRGRRFDLLLHMQASWRANGLAWQIPAQTKLGFDRKRARDGQWLFTNHHIAPKPRCHVMEGLFGFAEACGVTERTLRWDIPLSDEHRDFARRVIPEGTSALLISPCSSQRARNFRNWSPQRYAAVARHAIERRGMKVILTGAKTELEAQYGRDIGGLTKGKAVNLVGQTSLKQLLALIQRARAVLCPDSGPAHMAGTVGTPVIGLYASSNPLRTGPIDPRWTVNVYPEAVQAEFGKSVDEVRWGQRVRDPDVMQRISTEAVIAKLDEILSF